MKIVGKRKDYLTCTPVIQFYFYFMWVFRSSVFIWDNSKNKLMSLFLLSLNLFLLHVKKCLTLFYVKFWTIIIEFVKTRKFLLLWIFVFNLVDWNEKSIFIQRLNLLDGFRLISTSHFGTVGLKSISIQINQRRIKILESSL